MIDIMSSHGSAVLFLLLLTPAVLASEDLQPFGPIAPADLAMKDNPAEPGAAAMILLDDVTTRDDKRYERHHVIIKIFTDEGRSRADVELYYVDRLTAIEEIRGRTVHADGTISTFDGTVFDRTVIKNRRLKLQVKKFALPAVAAGDVIEYAWTTRWKWRLDDAYVHAANYTFNSVFAESSTSWELQGDLYVREAHYSLYPVPGARLDWFVFPPTSAAEVQHDSETGVTRIDLKNMPALEKEEFSLPDEMLRPTAYFSYVAGTVFSSPTFFWQAVGERRTKAHEKFIGRSKAIKTLVDAIITTSDSSDLKLRKLYARTQQLRLLSFETERTEAELKKERLRDNRNVDDVLKHGYAWSNEANLFFVALARAAGFSAFPVELRSRDFGYLKQNVWDEHQLNAMIVAVEVRIPCRSAGGTCWETRFLDPASQYCPYKLVPWEETGQSGLANRGFGADFVNVPGLGPEAAVVEREADLYLSADGTLEGDLRVTYTGQPALERRRDGNNLDATGRRKLIEDEIKGWLAEGDVLEAVRVEGWSDGEQPLHVDAHVRLPSYAQVTPRRILAALDPFNRHSKNPFRPTTRKTSVYFKYAMRSSDHITIHAPEGYVLDQAPASTRFSNRVGSLDRTVIGYRQSDGTGHVSLKLQRQFQRDGFAFPLAEYPLVRELYDFVTTADGEMLALRSGSDK